MRVSVCVCVSSPQWCHKFQHKNISYFDAADAYTKKREEKNRKRARDCRDNSI